jgi:two-component system NarL family response regulator
MSARLEAARRPPQSRRDQPTVLIADGQHMLRGFLGRLLERNGFIVCAEAADGSAAIDAAIRAEPDICLIAVDMPGNGIAATAAIRAMVPGAKVVVLAVSRSDTDVFRAIEAGAVGYLLKDGSLEELPAVLRRVTEGEALLSGGLVARVLDEFRRRARCRHAFGGGGERPLTQRECEVLDLLADDLSTAEVAQRLGIEEVTVRSHVASIVRKLQVGSRQAAVRLYRAGVRDPAAGW